MAEREKDKTRAFHACTMFFCFSHTRCILPPIFLSDGYPRVTDGYDHRYGRKFKGLFQPVFHLCIMKRASLGSPFLRRTFRTQRSSEGHHFFCRIFFLECFKLHPSRGTTTPARPKENNTALKYETFKTAPQIVCVTYMKHES